MAAIGRNPERITLDRVRSALSLDASASEFDDARAHAAVAAVLKHGEPGLEVLLIERAQRAGDPWAGHMALPGGRAAASDPNLLATAIRETQEEVGLDLLRDAEPLGRLPALRAIARGRALELSVTPFVFALEQTPQLLPNAEVASILWAPLDLLSSGTIDRQIDYQLSGKNVRLPSWEFGDRVIWGLTHRMLSSLLERLRDTDTQPDNWVVPTD